MVTRSSTELRKEIKQYRMNLTDTQVKEASKIIQEKVYQDMIDHKYQDILCFYPLPKEVDLCSLYERLLSEDYRLYFPKTIGQEIIFYRIMDMGGFRQGAFHVMEPVGEEEPFSKDGAYAIIPGLAFDRRGHRIGYGGGYYDRFLENHPGIYKAGVAFAGQMYEEIPNNPWDVAMNIVWTNEI